MAQFLLWWNEKCCYLYQSYKKYSRQNFLCLNMAVDLLKTRFLELNEYQKFISWFLLGLTLSFMELIILRLFFKGKFIIFIYLQF